MKNEYFECGKIVNTHGVRGAVKIESYCNTPLELSRLPFIFLKTNGVYERHMVVKAAVYKNHVIATIEGIDTVDAAEAMKNTVIYAHRSSLVKKSGDVFIADLIGLPVIDANTGRIYGRIAEVERSPASDIYNISTENGYVLLPVVKEFVKDIDIERGVYISPIPGFFDEI